mmetsp:Transcript_62593/g.145727  ORF Transcript_62593/g.145727 Transcript_62593/m.145727 type:complete len:247 (+) Transcript_62593:729-1469(+)
MRKRQPSSAVRSKTGTAHSSACRMRPSSVRYSGRGSSCPSVRGSTFRASAPAAISKSEVQESGKSGPAAPMEKSTLQKWALRRSQTRCSSSSSCWSLSPPKSSGGVKSSSSMRRSDMRSLKIRLNWLRCFSLKTALALSSSFQKQLPMQAHSLSSSPHAMGPCTGPGSVSSKENLAWSKANLSRLKSTPRGPKLDIRVEATPPGWKSMPRRATMAPLGAKPRRAWMALPAAPGAMRNRPRPNCTPP